MSKLEFQKEQDILLNTILEKNIFEKWKDHNFSSIDKITLNLFVNNGMLCANHIAYDTNGYDIKIILFNLDKIMNWITKNNYYISDLNFCITRYEDAKYIIPYLSDHKITNIANYNIISPLFDYSTINNYNNFNYTFYLKDNDSVDDIYNIYNKINNITKFVKIITSKNVYTIEPFYEEWINKFENPMKLELDYELKGWENEEDIKEFKNIVSLVSTVAYYSNDYDIETLIFKTDDIKNKIAKLSPIKDCDSRNAFNIRLIDLSIIACNGLPGHKYEIGYFDTDMNIISSNIAMAIVLYRMEERFKRIGCDTCSFSPLCHKGCFVEQYNTTNDPLISNKKMCNIEKERIKHLILWLYKNKVEDIFTFLIRNSDNLTEHKRNIINSYYTILNSLQNNKKIV